MRELVVISGKAETGKTNLNEAFASLTKNGILCDADEDAEDLDLLMEPGREKRTFCMGGSIAAIRTYYCSRCNRCLELCRFDAVSEIFTIDEISCECCGFCVDLCLEQDIDFHVQKCGEWFVFETRYCDHVQARPGIAEENSGKLMRFVRQQAKVLAEEKGNGFILNDDQTGIRCPVIAAIGGATALVVIVEPTVSGLYDMTRVADLAVHFKVPGLVCVNKYDLNTEITEEIEAIAQERNMKIVGRIPFDPLFSKAMIVGQNIVEYKYDSETASSVRKVWEEILQSQSLKQMELKDFSAVIL
ncbi:MAG: (4Fe-4S)-binding protein [Desulfobulbaceae bacterium]|nr:(4Fe-4S)-binding protein [Desulfobulbaceae bacterium]